MSKTKHKSIFEDHMWHRTNEVSVTVSAMSMIIERSDANVPDPHTRPGHVTVTVSHAKCCSDKCCMTAGTAGPVFCRVSVINCDNTNVQSVPTVSSSSKI